MIERIEELQERVRPAAADERERAREAVRALARPRLTGSEEAAEVETELRERFTGLGYEIREMPFSFSALPGRFGVPVIGAIAVIGFGLATLFIGLGAPLAALIILIAALLLAVAVGFAGGWMMRRLPWGRLDTANWLVHRPGASPRLLVMAHRDSKSQMVPILFRSLGAVATGLAWTALVIVAAVAWTTDVEVTGVAVVLLVVGILAALPLLLSWSGNRSPGALDNATGLATLLGLAQRLKDDPEVAFLVTDGEELGLAGARDVAARLPRVEGIVNIDGIDDDGSFLILDRHGVPPRGYAPHLSNSLFSAARLLDLPVERRSLPIGIRVDHLPLVAEGHAALTLMRGRRSSLMRVHLAGDDVDATSGRGVADAVALVEGALAIRRTPFASADGTLPEGLRPR